MLYRCRVSSALAPTSGSQPGQAKALQVLSQPLPGTGLRCGDTRRQGGSAVAAVASKPDGR